MSECHIVGNHMPRFKSHFISANILSVILLGLSKGIILGSMTVVALDMLGSSRLSTGMGIMGCVNGTITAAIGPLHGNVSSLYYVHTFSDFG